MSTNAEHKTRRICEFRSYKETFRNALNVYVVNEKAILLIAFFAILLRVITPYLGVLLPKIVADGIMKHDSYRYIVNVASLGCGLVFATYLQRYTDTMIDSAAGTISVMRFQTLKISKQIHMDYEKMEDPNISALHAKADQASANGYTPGMRFIGENVAFLSNLLGAVLYAFIIGSVHIAILLLLVVNALIQHSAMVRYRKFRESTSENRSMLLHRVDVLIKTLQNPKAAKDIRLFSSRKWLVKHTEREIQNYELSEDELALRQKNNKILGALLTVLRDGLVYAYLVYLVITKKLEIGDFLLVFGVVASMSGWIIGIIKSYNELQKSITEMKHIQEYLLCADSMPPERAGQQLDANEFPPSIVLHNVSYKYCGAPAATLEEINLHIHSGERLAVVGVNGAGKTTLVKLLCGLYEPTTGSITISGKNTGTHMKDNCFELFSVVFQDIHLLSCDIAGNVSQQTPEETDMNLVWHCLEASGLADKVRSLTSREKTQIVKMVHPDAIELSGGELQKLALARALYKNAPVLILDEPTAALDPIAEDEVYQQYASLTKGKTSVFISHRLASTRFCDRIVLLGEGRILEEGTHESLIKMNGVYANMFQVQASQYK